MPHNEIPELWHSSWPHAREAHSRAYSLFCRKSALRLRVQIGPQVQGLAGHHIDLF